MNENARVIHDGVIQYYEPVMFVPTLRDYFAARATDGDVSKYLFDSTAGRLELIPGMTREKAKFAYADAMIAARNQTQK